MVQSAVVSGSVISCRYPIGLPVVGCVRAWAWTGSVQVLAQMVCAMCCLVQCAIGCCCVWLCVRQIVVAGVCAGELVWVWDYGWDGQLLVLGVGHLWHESGYQWWYLPPLVVDQHSNPWPAG